MAVRRHLRNLYSLDARERWNAVRALGDHAEDLYPTRPGRVAELVRRLAWSLNEESGATGWGAPEAMGEILARIPDLRGRYRDRFPAYLSHAEVFLDNEVLDAGAIWALGRLGVGETGDEDALSEEIERFLAHPSPTVRGIAAWTAGRLRLGGLRAAVEGLLGDGETLYLLLEDGVSERSVGALARDALPRLE